MAAAIPTQAVLSQVPDGGTSQADVDPDCLPPDEAAQYPAGERDGVCPATSDDGNAPPPPQPPSDPPPKQTPPAATTGQSGGAGTEQTSPGRGSAIEVTGEGGRETGRDRRSDRARRKGSRQGGRRKGGPSGARDRHTRRGTRRRQARRLHGRRSRARNGTHSRRRSLHASGRRTLGPIPRWANSLLTQPLPDPLPAGKRLDLGFARVLERATSRHDVSWPLMLAILRARGHEGAVPATRAEVRALARKLARLGAKRHPRRAIEALSNAPVDSRSGIGTRMTFADRVLALAGFHRAVGLRGLVRGLDAVKPALIERVLSNSRLGVYPGGRADVKAGRIDGRVLVLLLYMADRHRGVTVSSLQSGHGFLTKSGNVSAHSFGRAVDIGALDGVSIAGHQDPGGVTERALWSILLLPAELRPSQLISLFDLGGPSFAMADHADHIHVGY